MLRQWGYQPVYQQKFKNEQEIERKIPNVLERFGRVARQQG
jgi:hypothetical protein